MSKCHMSLGYVDGYSNRWVAACGMINPGISSECYDRLITCKKCRKAMTLELQIKCLEPYKATMTSLGKKELRDLKKRLKKKKSKLT